MGSNIYKIQILCLLLFIIIIIIIIICHLYAGYLQLYTSKGTMFIVLQLFSVYSLCYM
jgi:hypothetical protein